MSELKKYNDFKYNDLKYNDFIPNANYLPGLYSTPITQLVRDQTKINNNPFIFNQEVTPKFSITDQKSSGRCWLFATLNLIRIVSAQNLESDNDYNIWWFKSKPKELEFSQTYLYFWDKLERYHRSIRYYLDIKKTISQELQDQYLKAVVVNRKI